MVLTNSLMSLVFGHMSRKLRIQFPGAIYHLMSRGDRREAIFLDDHDRESFLQTLGDTCVKTGWQVHAFCLMPNHFHLVVETPQPNLVSGMKWLLGTYTARFNRRHRLSGHVFAGRYKSLLVAGEGGYLLTVCDYVHLNPVRGKLLRPEFALKEYRWSSFVMFCSAPSQRPSWLRVDRLFGECAIPEDSGAGRREFERVLEARRAQESGEEFESIRRGWCFGDEEFRRELLAQVEGGVGKFHYGSEIQEAAEAKAIRIIDEELRRAVWTEAELALRKKGDPRKVQIAHRLRAETTVTLQWIAARLHMGTKTHLSHLLYWLRRTAGGHAPSMVTTRPTRQRLNRSGVANKAIPLTDPRGAEGFDISFD
jgi:putative transposase